MALTEHELGQKWAELARAEGHRRAVPTIIALPPQMRHPHLVSQIRDLYAEGKTRAEIAHILGVDKSRVSQLCKKPT